MHPSRLAVWLILVPLAFPAGKTASQLAKEAERAEHNGDLSAAYLLYSEAAAKDPSNKIWWLRSQTLRPAAAAKAEISKPEAGPAAPVDPTLVGTITERDIDESRELLPPVELKGSPDRKDFDLKGDAKALFEQVGRAFGLEPVFDTAYQSKGGLRIQLTDADFRDALRALEMTTGSFVVPASEHRFFVAEDSTSKRAEFDRTASVVILAPEPVTVQELQEIGTAIRGTLDIQRLMVDTTRHMILIRDRVSKVLLAQKLVADLMRGKAQVAVEVELLEVNETSSLSYGLSLPDSFSLVWFKSGNSNLVPGTAASGNYLSFGGGKSLLGLGITDASLFANVTKSSSKTLLQSEVVTSDGQPATLHVGDKYPIVTNGYFGTTTGTGTVYRPPPTFNFEDLGLLLKVTPFVHGLDEITLEVESEFKLLGSKSIDDIPIISNRKFQSKVRLKAGEWAVLAGLMTDSEGRTVSGLAGLSVIPFLRSNTKMRSHGETLIVLKPHLLSLPPSETMTQSAWVGTETRPRTSL